MARQIEQVGQDLNQIKAASSELGRELTAAYRSYFSSLAPTLKQQSIQGCYYLCTNCYPEAFMKLNYDRRSQLLKTLQRVIGNAIANLVVHIEPARRASNNDDDPTGELTSIPVMPIDWFATPDSLSTWQQNLEGELNHSLKEISYKVNLLLQQAEILPQNIPRPILDASPEADRQGGNTPNVSNILSVLIGQNSDREKPIDNFSQEQLDRRDEDEDDEAEDNDEDNFSQFVQIQSLYLRLIEVEFSDATVLSLRKNIDRLTKQITSLKREYIQKKQELKIAEAESAWRNSWFEAP